MIVPVPTLRTRGFKSIRLKLNRRERALTNVAGLARKFERYTMKQRVPRMFKNGGRIYGIYGAGYYLWKKNTAWVRRVKADARVFFQHGRTKSGLEEAMRFRWSRRKSSNAATVVFSLTCDHPAAKYIRRGFPEKEITARDAEALEIPFGFGQTIVRKSVMRGAMPARPFEGFRKGDRKKLLRLALDSVSGVSR